jgi:hypothetical protein
MAFLGKHKGKRIRLSHAISHGDILAIINSVFRGLLFDSHRLPSRHHGQRNSQKKKKAP